MTGFIIFFLGFFIFVIIAIFAVLGKVLFSGATSFIKSPPKKAHVTILDKRKQDMLRSSGVYTNYFVCFKLSHDDKLELPVNKRLYKKATVGDTGTLTYKGNYFVSFVFDKDLKPKSQKETYILNGEIIEKE